MGRIRPLRRRPVGSKLAARELYDSRPGTTAVADVVDAASNAVRLVAVSFYGEWEYLPGDEGIAASRAIYSTTTCHRLISDLTPLLVGPGKNMHRVPVLLAGDVNATTQIAAETHWHVERDETRVLFDRLDVLGLRDVVARTRGTSARLDPCSCTNPESCSHVRTFRSGNRVDSRPTQLDYVFASEQLAAQAKCEVHDEAAAWALSDHCPLVIDLPDR